MWRASGAFSEPTSATGPTVDTATSSERSSEVSSEPRTRRGTEEGVERRTQKDQLGAGVCGSGRLPLLGSGKEEEAVEVGGQGSRCWAPAARLMCKAEERVELRASRRC